MNTTVQSIPLFIISIILCLRPTTKNYQLKSEDELVEYDSEYIEAEIRNDWEISEKMKKVWWVQLDLIKKLDRICDTNNLKWYPMWGTLLGAVRHQGYIPWDDDVDIVMPREDYESLISIAESELESPYFLQSTITDEDCFYMWVSLRNSETTGNRRSCLQKRQNNGIGIDIMPLDGCEDSLIKYIISRFPVRLLSVLSNTYVNDFNKSASAVLLRKLLRFIGFDYRCAYNIAEGMNRKHKLENYKKLSFRAHADILYQGRNLIRDMWDKTDFSDTIRMPFETITVPVPIGYDHILKQIYGDYNTLPPFDSRKGRHEVVFDPDVPYKEYCSKQYGVVYTEDANKQRI